MSLSYQLNNPEDNLTSVSSYYQRWRSVLDQVIQLIAQKLVEMITLKQILLDFFHKRNLKHLLSEAGRSGR